jgi:alpha-L-fucosidase 2
MGMLLWGEGNHIRLSLDRGDLWDERPSKRFSEVKAGFTWKNMQRLVGENRMAEFDDIFDSNYDYNGSPTKLPAGRVELLLDPSQTAQSFDLNLARAEAGIGFSSGASARAFVDADNISHPLAMLRISGPDLREVRLKVPDSVKGLGYPTAVLGEREGIRWFEQKTLDQLSYAVCVGWKRVADETLLAVTVETDDRGKSAVAAAKSRVESALAAGYQKLFKKHEQWWTRFWARSHVSIPEPKLMLHYNLVRYFYGSASRRGAPPMPLQGVWSADAGTLPPWKGDYHNDLNTQMTYLAYRTSGDFEEGRCFLDFLWDRLPRFRRFANEFYDAPGAAVPGVMSRAGDPLGGWGQYSLSPTMGAWIGHLFYLHWRTTADVGFLKSRAYPFCREIGTCLKALLKLDRHGVLTYPLSSSPEIFDNSKQAFLNPNSNFDIACTKMLFLGLAEMASKAGDQKDSTDWSEMAKRLGPFHTADDGAMLLDSQTRLPGSHRHLSNLMMIHPFNLVTIDGDDMDRREIEASLKDWAKSGTKAWCGYTFSWMSCLRARVGDAEAAIRNLDIYTSAFILRNGFHANGDQTKSGYSDFTYRPFTLEGNFLAMEAVHEMLIQSWNPTTGSGEWGTIRLFPATPWRWHAAAFDDFRVEGGHRVSARRENNATTWFRIIAGSGGIVRIRDNFGGRTPTWSRSGVTKVGSDFEVRLRRGESIEATLAAPASIPPPPVNLAIPVGVTPD